MTKHPIGPDDKPMMDWYYDGDGVCRPSPSVNFRQKAAECYAEFKQSHDPAEEAAADVYNEAADEIERLAKELRISNKALSMCSDECNRSYELADRSDARHKEKIEQLVAENKELKKTLHHFLRERETDMGTAE